MIGFPLDSHVTFDTDGTPIYDRAITSDPYRKLLKTLFTNGILPDVSTNLQVMAKEGLTLSVLSGFAMVEGCMKWQEKDLTVTLDPGDSLPRIDRVVMRLNVNDDVRDCELAIIKGTPAASPVAPDLVRSSSVYDICLAAVTVNSNTQEITNSNINDTRYDSNVCGVISSLSEFDTTTLYNQIQSDLREFKEINEQDFTNWTDYEKNLWQSWVSTNEADFLAWYDRMKDQLSQDAAGNLQLQIDALDSDLSGRIDNLEAEMPFAGGSKVNINFEYDVVPNVQYSNEHYKLTVGDTVRENNFSSSELHFNEYGILTVGDGVLEVTYDVTDLSSGKITPVLYTQTLSMPYFGRFIFDVTLSANVYGYENWLRSIGKDASQYATINDVFADEKLLRELMTRHASVDYLVGWLANNNEDAHTILNNDYCAKWINLRDYALDKLYANPTVKAVMDEVDKYGYGEWALIDGTWQPKGNVPVMTSDTAPYGKAFASSTYSSGYEAWKAFDGTENLWHSTTGSSGYIGYKFVKPTCVKKFTITNRKNKSAEDVNAPKNIQLQGSNDNSTWNNIGDVLVNKDGSNVTTEFTVENKTFYLYYRVNVLSSYDTFINVQELQFYGRQLNVSVPTMTSNTAPWGEASASDTSVAPYKVFNGIENSESDGYQPSSAGAKWLSYDFLSSVCATMGYIVVRNNNSSMQNMDIYIEGSNDKTTWESLCDDITIAPTPIGTRIYFNFNASKKRFRYYRLHTRDGNYLGNDGLKYVQIYGINFYGFDYSEREFAEGSTMKYLYDHGVELENLGSLAGVVKAPSYFLLEGKTNNIYSKQDLSKYKLLRASSDKIAIYDGKQNNYVMVWNKEPIGDALALAQKILTVSALPNHIYLDIGSVTQDTYCGFEIISTSPKISINEWWLE